MSPTCSRAGFRLLTTVLVASSIANAAALPHQVLDPRTPLAQDDAPPEAEMSITAAPAGPEGDDPENIFEEFGELLNNHSGYQFLRDLVERLFGVRTEDDGGENAEEATITTTVFVTPTPEPFSAPPGPPAPNTTSEVSAEATPEPAPTDLMSILPVGSLTTAINLTLPEPVFSTGAVEPVSIAVVIPPFPFNATLVGPTATAVPITAEFSAAVAPASANASTPTTTFESTTVLLVTATVVPVPVDVSAGTAINTPISDAAAPLWANSTLAAPTAPSGTGAAVSAAAVTGYSNATAAEAPTYPNTTEVVVPVLVSVSGGAATALDISVPVTLAPYANATAAAAPTPISGTDSPLSAEDSNSTYASPTGFVGTGTVAALSAGTIAPVTFSENPTYPNSTLVVPVVILGTATTAFTAATISNVPILDTAEAIYPNVTTMTSTTTTTITPPLATAPSAAPSLAALALNVTITVNATETTSNDTTLEFPG